MTLQPAFAIDGATYSGAQLRMMQRITSGDAEGVTTADDLAVLPLPTPGAGVRIITGQGLVRGRDGLGPGDSSLQGTYAIWNSGDHTVELDGTAGVGPRQDLLILRVEDPTWPGAGWTGDPEQDVLVRPHVIQGVPNGTSTIPSSYPWSAIPLARIEWPDNTSTVTAEMIHDVRQVALPRSLLVKRSQRGIEPFDYAGNIQSPDWENWPDLVWRDVTIPTWATQVQIDAIWGQPSHDPADTVSGSGTTDARGWTRVAIGNSPNLILSRITAYNFEVASTSTRVSIFNFDQQPIPEALRGATVPVRMQVSGQQNARGRLRADLTSTYRVNMLFQEVAVPDLDGP